jgi:hypothetical protein
MRFNTVAVLTLLLLLVASSFVSSDPLFKGSESVPSDAIVLFDGEDLSNWVLCGTDKPLPWKLENGYMEITSGNACSRQKFNDFQLHIEFWLPLMADAKGQDRANSGVYLKGAYEIQVLDSYGLKSGHGDCGAMYGIAPPMVNACRPPEQWQSYDIVFHEPRFDENGVKTENARVTVFHNGALIHYNALFPAASRGAIAVESSRPEPIFLQDHGCPVRYRNIWVRPLPKS